MIFMKVEILCEEGYDVLEEAINEFIAGKKIIDIKYSISQEGPIGEDVNFYFTALIMYES